MLAKGCQPRTCNPTAAAASCCSAMYISKIPIGVRLGEISAYVELLTSPSSATTSPRALPSAASASPYALRVASLAAQLVHGKAAARRASKRCGSPRALGLGHVDVDVADAAQLGDRLVGVRQRLAVHRRSCWRPPATPWPFSVRATIDGRPARGGDRLAHRRRSICRRRRARRSRWRASRTPQAPGA